MWGSYVGVDIADSYDVCVVDSVPDIIRTCPIGGDCFVGGYAGG